MPTRRHTGLRLLIAGAVLISLVACGGDDEGTSATSTASSTTNTTLGTTTTSSGVDPADQREVRAYFLRDERVGPTARAATGEAVAAAALEGLLAGPTTTEQQLGFSSAIPAGTELLGVVVEDGIATVDLSTEFGSGGGSASMMSRVAQVVFTLTQFPTVDEVSFKIDGEAVSALGGEGLLLDEPQTRAHWESLAPAILVETPLPFSEVTSPLRIRGTANTFEAQFRVNVVDGDGLIAYDQPAMASSGSGTRGTFDITATFEVPRAGVGAVIVFEESAEDGRQIHIVEVPIRVSG